MNIHEYQAKEIFKKYGIPVGKNILVYSAEEAFKAAQELALIGGGVVVKAQVHAGGRGKGGGIKLVKTPEEARDLTKKFIGGKLVTPQTGEEGKPIDSVLIEVLSKLDKQYYVSVILDRSAGKPCLIFSEAGGMDIEEVAHTAPEKILKLHFELTGLDAKTADSFSAGFEKSQAPGQSFSRIFQALSKIFLELDASLVEINPLAVTGDGQLLAVDAKINFDDNALYRHPEIEKLRDPNQEDSRETEAKKFDLSYVGLDGNIGCAVNGAGLAMATMDIITFAGGKPANFLDVGGGASKEKVAAAFRIILKDPKVKAILVNIFGGIMRCDVMAEGILAAASELGLKVPLVVRLEGTNAEEGKKILNQSGLKIISAENFEDAAKKAVEAAQ